MQVLFFVLNAPEKLDALLSEMERHGIHGATIFESTGMARVLNSRHKNHRIRCGQSGK